MTNLTVTFLDMYMKNISHIPLPCSLQVPHSFPFLFRPLLYKYKLRAIKSSYLEDW